MSQNRSQVREALKRLLGRRLGEILKTLGIPQDVLLNKNYEKLQHFQNWTKICKVEDLDIVKNAIDSLKHIGRNKAFSDMDVITQLAAILSGGIKGPGYGIGAEDELFDNTE